MLGVYFFVFLFGLCIGSFLNVVVYRLPRGISLLRPRSSCPKCKKKIAWFDNLPLFSFVLLGGRCRACRSPISLKYPLVEIITGIVTLIIFFFQFSPLRQDFAGQAIISLICYLVLAWGLIAIFFIDFEHQIIPDEILLPITVVFLIYKILLSLFVIHGSWFAPLLPAFGAFLFLFLIWAITRGRGMGFGDVKLAFLIGLVLGFPKIVIAFYIAFLTGAFISIILILVKKARFGQQIAFGPFLAFSTLVALIWGEKILKLAQNFLF